MSTSRSFTGSARQAIRKMASFGSPFTPFCAPSAAAWTAEPTSSSAPRLPDSSAPRSSRVGAYSTAPNSRSKEVSRCSAPSPSSGGARTTATSSPSSRRLLRRSRATRAWSFRRWSGETSPLAEPCRCRFNSMAASRIRSRGGCTGCSWSRGPDDCVTWRVPLDRLAAQLPLTQRYPSHLQRVLQPAHEMLIAAGLLRDASFHQADRDWHVDYVLATRNPGTP